MSFSMTLPGVPCYGPPIPFQTAGEWATFNEATPVLFLAVEVPT